MELKESFLWSLRLVPKTFNLGLFEKSARMTRLSAAKKIDAYTRKSTDNGEPQESRQMSLLKVTKSPKSNCKKTIVKSVPETITKSVPKTVSSDENTSTNLIKQQKQQKRPLTKKTQKKISKSVEKSASSDQNTSNIVKSKRNNNPPTKVIAKKNIISKNAKVTGQKKSKKQGAAAVTNRQVVPPKISQAVKNTTKYQPKKIIKKTVIFNPQMVSPATPQISTNLNETITSTGEGQNKKDPLPERELNNSGVKLVVFDDYDDLARKTLLGSKRKSTSTPRVGDAKRRSLDLSAGRMSVDIVDLTLDMDSDDEDVIFVEPAAPSDDGVIIVEEDDAKSSFEKFPMPTKRKSTEAVTEKPSPKVARIQPLFRENFPEQYQFEDMKLQILDSDTNPKKLKNFMGDRLTKALFISSIEPDSSLAEGIRMELAIIVEKSLSLMKQSNPRMEINSTQDVT